MSGLTLVWSGRHDGQVSRLWYRRSAPQAATTRHNYEPLVSPGRPIGRADQGTRASVVIIQDGSAAVGTRSEAPTPVIPSHQPETLVRAMNQASTNIDAATAKGEID